MELSNIFSGIPNGAGEEVFETIWITDHFHLERIVSSGQATSPGEWLEEPADEWVIVLAGSAGLLFEGRGEPTVLHPGDYVHIPAHRRHRVEWTAAERKTVWLALHYPSLPK